MILLTGGTGFLGRYLLDTLLAEGHAVRALVRNPKAAGLLRHPRLEWVTGDVIDRPSLQAAMSGVRQVVHAAAVVSFWPRRYAEMRRINVEGTANVVNRALEHGVEKLVHVSSIAALGRYPGIGVINEATQWRESELNSQYAVTKYLAEREVQRAVAKGLRAILVHPSVIIGPAPNWTTGTARFWTMVNNGLKFYNPGSTSFVSASDVARAIHLLLTHGPDRGERFLLAAENVEYRTFFQWVARSLGKPAPSIPISPFLTRLVGTLSEWKANLTGTDPLVSRETARIGSISFQYDGSLITRTLKDPGFQYSSIEETVMKTGKAFQESPGTHT